MKPIQGDERPNGIKPFGGRERQGGGGMLVSVTIFGILDNLIIFFQKKKNDDYPFYKTPIDTSEKKKNLDPPPLPFAPPQRKIRCRL